MVLLLFNEDRQRGRCGCKPVRRPLKLQTPAANRLEAKHRTPEHTSLDVAILMRTFVSG